MNTVRSAKLLLILFGVLVASGLAAHALIPPAPEIHGKPTIKLSKKFSLDLPNGATGVAWSPDGSTLAVSSNYGMRLNTFDSSGLPLSEFQSRGTEGFALQRLAFVNGSAQVLFPIENMHKADATLDIRDVASGRIVKTITANFIAQHFAVSPDQKRFAIAGGIHGEAIVYATEDGKDWRELSTVKGSGTPLPGGKTYWFNDVSLCFFPDSKLLAIGKSNGHFGVADSTTGETIKEFHTYDSPFGSVNIDGLAVSPKGDLLLTGRSGGLINSTYRDPMASSPIDVWRHGRKIATYVNSPGLKAWENESPIRVWRISDGKQVASLGDTGKLVRQAVWDPKGRFVALVDTDSLIVWQPEQPGENFIRVKYPHLTSSLATSHDGKSVAVAGGHTVIVYNIE